VHCSCWNSKLSRISKNRITAAWWSLHFLASNTSMLKNIYISWIIWLIYVYILYNLHLYYDCCNMPSLYRRALYSWNSMFITIISFDRNYYISFYLPDVLNTILLIERIFLRFASIDYFYMAQCFFPRHTLLSYRRVLKCLASHSAFFSSVSDKNLYYYCALARARVCVCVWMSEWVCVYRYQYRQTWIRLTM